MQPLVPKKKMAVASQLGADLVIAYSVQSVMEAVLEVTNGLGVDRIVEVDFGSNVALDAQILRSKGAIGTYSSSGYPRFDFNYYDFGYKGARINFVQVYMLSANERALAVQDLNSFMADGRLQHTIAGSFGLERIVKAHVAQESSNRIGNIVLEI